MSIWSFCGSRLSGMAASCLPEGVHGADRRRRSGRCGVLFGAVVSCWLLSGCAQSEYEQAMALSRPVQSEESFIGLESVPDELRELGFAEIEFGGAGSENLGAARMFREVGLFEFLESYIINIPASASFLAHKELSTAIREHGRSGERHTAGSAAVIDFEHRVLILGASGAQADLVGDSMERTTAGQGDGAAPGELHEAFFDAFEQCGRESPWPDVELFVMGNGYAGDYLPQLVQRDFDISHFEYRELLHVCGRYAATYPTLDPQLRDELLAQQRAHYAEVILDQLDNPLLRPVEVPPEYQDEIDDLRASGW